MKIGTVGEHKILTMIYKVVQVMYLTGIQDISHMEVLPPMMQ
jgi:hypothetical protein